MARPVTKVAVKSLEQQLWGAADALRVWYAVSASAVACVAPALSTPESGRESDTKAIEVVLQQAELLASAPQ